MPPDDPLIGTVLQGRYRVLRWLGGGGMGTVYLGEQLSIGRQVAIKLLPAQYAADEEFVKRFRREAKQAAAVTDPRVVATYDFGRTDDDNLFIVMEYVSGHTLKSLIQQGPLPVDRAVDLALELAEALQAAHRAGIIHRDIKPDNIMIDEYSGGLKLMDFGIAKPADVTGHSRLTQSGLIIGTPKYMSPEQIEGGQISARTDLYAWAIVLYEMLSGEAPFTATTAASIYVKHLQEQPRPVRQLRSEVPAALERMLMRCLEKKSAQRPADMAEVIRELRRLRGPEPRATAPTLQPHIAVERSSGASRALLVAISLLALLFAASTAYLAVHPPAELAPVAGSAATDAGHRKQVDDLNAKLAALQHQAAALTLIQNGTFKVCNTGSAPAKINWLGVTYRDGDKGFATFNSAFNGYKTWEIAAKGSRPLELRDGDKTVWDGAVVFYAMELAYRGETYNLAGAWSGVDGDCLKHALSDPDEIRRSRRDPAVLLFYRGASPRWLCAVVRREDGTAFLITAYPTGAIKAGEVMWIRSE